MLMLPLLAAAALPTLCHADQGALTVSGGGGLSFVSIKAPYTSTSPSLVGSAPLLWLESRYAIRNWLEVSASFFYEFKVSYTHVNVDVQVPNRGSFAGWETHSLTRYGALAGLHYVTGSVWRLVGGLETGWSHRTYSNLHQYNVSAPNNPVDYNLNLSNFGVDNLVLAPLVGVEWAFADHASLALVPRVQFLLGSNPSVAFSLPLLFAYSWYL